MIEIIKGLFGIARDSKGIVKEVQDERSRARGIKNQVLAEVEFNMDLILEHYLDKQVAVEKVIEKLRTASLSKALQDGFDFTKIRKGSITKEMAGDHPLLKKYAGYTCEALLRKILHHIEQIRLLPEFYDLKDEKKVNLKTRLENLGARYLLFVRFLKS